jgi:hypothetical protein
VPEDDEKENNAKNTFQSDAISLDIPKTLRVEHLTKIRPMCLCGRVEKISGFGFSV